MNKPLRLIISLGTPLLIGFLGSYFTTPNIPTWYATLAKPALNPPSWVFAPVWTILYLLMGYAFYLIWTQKTKLNKTHAYVLFFIQLFLNLIWSYLFFALRLPPLALVEIIILWLAILLTIFKFKAINKLAAYLLIPYILWVSFATYLTFQVVLLN